MYPTAIPVAREQLVHAYETEQWIAAQPIASMRARSRSSSFLASDGGATGRACTRPETSAMTPSVSSEAPSSVGTIRAPREPAAAR